MEPRKNKKRGFFEDFLEEDPFFDEYVSRIEESMARILEDAAEMDGEAKGFVYGFSMTQDADGKPVIQEFGGAPEKSEKKKAHKEGLAEAREREPLIDVMEDAEEIRVIAEVAGFSKEDIEVDAERTKVVIAADDGERKYYKEINLPSEVETGEVSTTYKNGVLEIVMKKIRKGEK